MRWLLMLLVLRFLWSIVVRVIFPVALVRHALAPQRYLGKLQMINVEMTRTLLLVQSLNCGIAHMDLVIAIEKKKEKKWPIAMDSFGRLIAVKP